MAFHFPLPLYVSELWAWAFDEAFWASCLIIRLRAVGQLLERLLWKSLIYLQRSRMAPYASPDDMSTEDKLQSRLFNKNKVSLACFPNSYLRNGREGVGLPSRRNSFRFTVLTAEAFFFTFQMKWSEPCGFQTVFLLMSVSLLSEPECNIHNFFGNFRPLKPLLSIHFPYRHFHPLGRQILSHIHVRSADDEPKLGLCWCSGRG